MQPGRKTLSELEAMVNRKIGQAVGEPLSHDDYLAWALEYRAVELLGQRGIGPWEAASLEQVVRFTGTVTYSPDPDDLLPGIPLAWLNSGGRDGTDKRLKVPGGRALKGRMRRFMTLLMKRDVKALGVRFHITELPKSQFGVVAFKTASHAGPLTMKMPNSPTDNRQVLNLRRARL